MMARTAPRLAVLTRASPLTTRDTVAADTPARRAMSRIVRDALLGPERDLIETSKVTGPRLLSAAGSAAGSRGPPCVGGSAAAGVRGPAAPPLDDPWPGGSSRA